MSDQAAQQEQSFGEWLELWRHYVRGKKDPGATNCERALREIERLQAAYAELEGYYNAAVDTGVEMANERDRLQREVTDWHKLADERAAEITRLRHAVRNYAGDRDAGYSSGYTVGYQEGLEDGREEVR